MRSCTATPHQAQLFRGPGVRAGDEEVQYVLLEVPDSVPDAALRSGATIALQVRR